MKIPRINGHYTQIYQPDADVFPGPDSLCFRAGQLYRDLALMVQTVQEILLWRIMSGNPADHRKNPLSSSDRY